MHLIDGHRYSEPLTPPRWSPSPPSLPPSLDTLSKVTTWKDDPFMEALQKSPEQAASDKRPTQQELTPSSSPEVKKVHWPPTVQDNQGKTTRTKPKEKSSEPRTKRKALSSRESRRIWYPPVPDPPSSRATPPAPRPRRLPTPDLDELEHGEFCPCCPGNSRSKMDAQLAAALSHIKGKRAN